MANVTRALFALVTFAAVTSPAAGQQASIDELRLDTDLQKPRFRLTSVEDGLPENSGLTMLQDRQGFLWIGTINGLVRHDGYTFKTYAADAADSTSLQSGLIRHLYEDSDGDIVASTNAGVSFLNPETDEFVTISKSDETSVGLAGTYANFAFEDSRGNYWIASAGDDESEGGLQLFDKESMTFIRTYTADSTREGTLTSNQVVALTEDPDGTLWIATYGGGLNYMDPQTETFGALRHNPGDSTSLASDKVNVVQVSREGELWVGTGEFFGQEEGGAVHWFDRNTRTFKRYLEKASDLDAQRSSSVVTIEQDAAGTIWVGSVFGGLSRYDRATDAFTTYTHDPSDPESLSGQSILSINSDRSGVLWVGSWSDGISSLNAASGRFPLIEHSPQDPNSLAVGDVMTVYEDRDRILWVGTDIGGLTRIDRFNNTFTRFVPDPRDPRSISHTFARIIYEDRSGVLWVGTFGNGLDRFDRRTGSFTHFRPDPTDPNSISHGSVRAIYEDNRGDFWVGTWGGGLNKLDRATGRFRSYKHDPSDPTSLPDDQISDIFEDTNGRLALTGNNIGDIMVFDPETEGFERIGDRVGVNGGTILVDSKGRTWGSGFGGFISYNPDLTRRRVYGVSDGLPTNVVTNVVESRDGSLWLSTERGLARFDPETERFKVYSRTSGLRLRSYTSLAVHASPTGELFFGGRGGVHAFFPERLVDNPTPPSVAVTEIRIHNKVVDVDPSGPLKKEVSRAESVQLRHDENDLGFTFAALHFESPQHNTYRYKLEGYDDDWIDAGTDRTATYTNLGPGRYTLRVLAANSDGVWSEDGASMSIRILPPWWRTVWAYVGYGLAGIALVFGVDKYQRRRLLARERERSRIEQAELRVTAAEAEAKLLQVDNDRKRNIELLSDIGRAITSSLSIDQIIETVYENVNNLMDAAVFGIGVLNPIARTIDFPASKEEGVSLAPFSHRLDDPNRLAVQCLERGEDIIIRNYAVEYERYVSLDLPPVAGGSPASVIYLPLVHQGKSVGVLTAQSFAENAYSDYHVNILRSLASYAAIALDNADAYRNLATTVDELKAAQEQLVHQEKLASLGELTAGIAHEIKNPLNFVNNFAEIGVELSDELREAMANGEEVGDLINDIQQSARQVANHGKRADAIVRAMMQHAAGGAAEYVVTDLNGLVNEYTDLAYHGKRARTPDFFVTMQMDLDPQVGGVEIIPQDIGRVLMNLVGNAFDAVRERATVANGQYKPQITVSTAAHGSYAEISVADNGTGMDEDVKDKIFQPFFTTKAPGDGTGLGLSLSHEIATKGHGGEMSVDSTKGEGTTFRLRLPITAKQTADK